MQSSLVEEMSRVSLEESRYKYESLSGSTPRIRLVTIDPAVGLDEPVSCTLDTVEFGERPYEALSYVWGDPTIKVPIMIEGKRLDVTPNLADALQHVRLGVSPRTMWIDAICIDQDNLEERGEQVRRMDMVYKSADRVVVWLGKYSEPEDDEVTFGENWGFEKLYAGTEDSVSAAFALAERMAATRDKSTWRFDSDLSVNVNDDPNVWGRLCLLFNRQWFKRLWVYQEIALARAARVVCGLSSVHWTDIKGAALAIIVLQSPYLPRNGPVHKMKIFSDLTFAKATGSVVNAGRSEFERANLMLLLRATSQSKCLDARDRLIGLLGVMPEADREDVVVDYTKDVKDCYRDWARNRMIRTKRLDVLSACEDSRSKGVPSWVPDFRTGDWGHDVLLWPSTHELTQSTFSASYSSTGSTDASILWISDNGNNIALRGYEIDRIAAISPPIMPVLSSTVRNDSASIFDLLATNWEVFIAEQLGQALTPSAPFYRAFLDVLFRGLKTGDSDFDIPFHLQYANWRGHAPASFKDDARTDASEEMHRLATSFANITLQYCLHHCQLFVTRSGMIGAVAEQCHVDVGDSIYVLLGD